MFTGLCVVNFYLSTQVGNGSSSHLVLLRILAMAGLLIDFVHWDLGSRYRCKSDGLYKEDHLI